MKKILLVFVFLLAGVARAKAPEEQPARFDFRSLGVAQVVQLIYAEALESSYVIDPEVLKDERVVSFRYNGGKPGVNAFIASFFDSLGLAVSRRGGVDFITRKASPPPAAAPDEEVFVYKPRFRDGGYLVELLGPLFKGSFTAKRGIRAAPGDNGGQRVAPTGSAAAIIDRKSDTLVFSGSAAEIVKLRKLLAQVDASAGDVLVRGVLYEVQTGKKDGSAFSLAVNLLGGKLGLSIGSNAGSPGDMLFSFKNNTIDAVLSVLSSDSRFKAVSKPMLRVSSGGSGRFTVGQDVPILGAVSYPGNGQPPIQSVSYQSSGVIYDVQPVIHDSAIDVTVMQQVSNFVSTSTGVSSSPTLIKRELRSDLGLADGEIVVMGGLTDTKDTDASQGPSLFPSFIRSRSSDSSGVEILLILQVTKI
ncbi:type II secretion system protein GspD [Massilia sp. BKSP1R2A-1]|uniref:type II secretion system protein GspD n=1 Tax=Massilia sp. BKSP1R2A-1 TaxID=3422595 RepID=UPI003D3322CB